MNRNISMAVTFIAGIIVGSAITYRVAEQKYRNIANDEIESVVERFSNRKPMDMPEKEVDYSEETDKVADKKVAEIKNVMTEYKDNIDRFNYDRVSHEKSKPKQGKEKEVVAEMEQPKMNPRIYVISPDEFNTLDGFSSETWYYSSDNYVLDADYEVVSDSDIARTIGHDPCGHFGEYEDDSVCIRNEELMCDYEILLSMKTCREIQED